MDEFYNVVEYLAYPSSKSISNDVECGFSSVSASLDAETVTGTAVPPRGTTSTSNRSVTPNSGISTTTSSDGGGGGGGHGHDLAEQRTRWAYRHSTTEHTEHPPRSTWSACIDWL
ncbi:hypothetical protein AYO20_00299 [Fonsecaea nubica]|uniref:Uncharacterized protein n=1 Tax=Fonsecaea nubica TaxID=856822 RepID=A0A178DH79_9EURO|nr:hypothetical protein AYO20_00299 [Fonsecaea nubica]OAL40563.1 hypothetical protein AYO20_00299 [Fonsecaea nubica]